MSWDHRGDRIDEEAGDIGPPDLSVLHRWELLHMIWEPFALGASGRVLSVLFRVLPPGRGLWLSMAASRARPGLPSIPWSGCTARSVRPAC